MYRRDYLVRMIEQFSMTLGQVMFQRQNRRFEEAMELLTQSMKQLLGLNSKLVRGLSAKDLLALLSTQDHLDAGKGLLLSDMVKTEGEILMDAGEESEAWEYMVKSLELLLEMNRLPEAEEVKQELQERVELLLTMLGRPRLPSGIMALLIHYFAETGQLAKAEDTLFFMLEDDPENLKLVQQGLEMFGDWLEMETDVLRKTGLTPQEVQESYDLLLKMKKNGS